MNDLMGEHVDFSCQISDAVCAGSRPAQSEALGQCRLPKRLADQHRGEDGGRRRRIAISTSDFG